FSAAHGTTYSPSERRSWLQPHNLLAQAAGETGIFGVITFAGFVVACLRVAGRVRSSLRSRQEDEARFLVAVSSAASAVCWLLLFFGLFAHNMMRYNWYLNAGIISACSTMAASWARRARQAE
ncbi:MAG: hypothetical protein V2A71_10125, partial [Candidatus Eisenbacteria bacterium]